MKKLTKNSLIVSPSDVKKQLWDNCGTVVQFTGTEEVPNFAGLLPVVFGLDQELGVLLDQVDLDEVSLQEVLRDAPDSGPAIESSLVSRATGHLKCK